LSTFHISVPKTGPHNLTAVDERICMSECMTAQTRHAPNVRYCKFSKMPSSRIGYGQDAASWVG